MLTQLITVLSLDHAEDIVIVLLTTDAFYLTRSSTTPRSNLERVTRTLPPVVQRGMNLSRQRPNRSNHSARYETQIS